MKEEIFLQKNYTDLDANLAVYGCNFLTLCYVTQFRNKRPAKVLSTYQDVIDYKNYSQKKGWLDKECFVLNAIAILSDLAPSVWGQAKSSDFGFQGADEHLPLAYPVDLPKDVDLQGGIVEIACYRDKKNANNTHFVLVETNQGRHFETREVFNSLGRYWLTDQKRRFFPSDKRVFYWVG